MWSDKGSAILGLSILFFVVMAGASYYKENGLYDVAHLRQEIEDLRGQADDVSRENARLRMALEGLKSSGYYVEAIARESLGLVRPGDVVYEFVDAKSLQRPRGVK
jgi:cell division protein FtsB